LFLSFTFANSVTVALHEIGHYIAIRAAGITDVKLFLHPYLSSYTQWSPSPQLKGLVDMAGPVFNIAVSLALFALLWKWRRRALLPFLLMAPVALFQEGFSSFMQIVLRQPGTDSIRMIESGMPMPALLIISIVFLLCGIYLFVALLPLFGIKKECGFFKTLAVVFGATALNMLIVLFFALGTAPGEVTRALILLAAMLLFSLVFSGLHQIKAIGKRTLKPDAPPDIRCQTLVLTGILALVPVVLGLVLFN